MQRLAKHVALSLVTSAGMFGGVADAHASATGEFKVRGLVCGSSRQLEEMDEGGWAGRVCVASEALQAMHTMHA